MCRRGFSHLYPDLALQKQFGSRKTMRNGGEKGEE
jgi:hypothetical protein